MFKSHLAVPVFVHADNIETDVIVPIRLMDIVIGCPDNQLTLLLLHKFLCIAVSGSAAVVDFDKKQYHAMLHDQVDVVMPVTVIGSNDLLTFGLQPFCGLAFGFGPNVNM